MTRARLDRLRTERPVEVAWRPLLTRPEPRPGEPGGPGGAGEAPAAEERRGGSPGEPEALPAELRDAARELGLPLRPPARRPDPRPGLEAAEFARDLGAAAFRLAQEALFRACFERGLDIGDREVLLTVAEEAGLDREGLEAALEDGRYRSELEAVLEEAERYGIPGTPTLLFGRFKLVGAAPLEEMRRAADRAAEDGA